MNNLEAQVARKTEIIDAWSARTESKYGKAFASSIMISAILLKMVEVANTGKIDTQIVINGCQSVFTKMHDILPVDQEICRDKIIELVELLMK